MNDYEEKDVFVTYGLVIRTLDTNIIKIKEFIKTLDDCTQVYDKVSYGRLTIREHCPSYYKQDGNDE